MPASRSCLRTGAWWGSSAPPTFSGQPATRTRSPGLGEGGRPPRAGAARPGTAGQILMALLRDFEVGPQHFHPQPHRPHPTPPIRSLTRPSPAAAPDPRPTTAPPPPPAVGTVV